MGSWVFCIGSRGSRARGNRGNAVASMVVLHLPGDCRPEAFLSLDAVEAFFRASTAESSHEIPQRVLPESAICMEVPHFYLLSAQGCLWSSGGSV